MCEFLCSHFNIEDEDMQHFHHIMAYYFQKGKMQLRCKRKDVRSVWRRCCD